MDFLTTELQIAETMLKMAQTTRIPRRRASLLAAVTAAETVLRLSARILDEGKRKRFRKAARQHLKAQKTLRAKDSGPELEPGIPRRRVPH